MMASILVSLLYYFVFIHVNYASLAAGQLVFPVPSGQYAVAHSTLKLTDDSRVDPYDPNHGKRNVMISLFYPIPRYACEQTCPIPYMPTITATYVDAFAAQYGVPNGTFGSIRMQVCCKPSRRVVKDVGKFPLVLFSPGLGGSRLLYNVLAESLASAGYAVATMDHTFEALVVEYPDGSFTPGLNASYWDPSIPGRLESLLGVRVEDGRFVLSQLGRKDVVRKLAPGSACGFNTSRVAFYGHSFGGATAISALMNDTRFTGAINMDGTQYGNQTDVKKPALLFGRAKPSPHNRTNDASWEGVWRHLKGWRRELGLEDSEHLTFGDVPLLLKLIRLPIPVKPIIGSLDGERSFEIITTYIEAFMDYVLKGKKSELFDGPSEKFPEIVVG
ncbi:hypothetical protein ACJQWK_04480 [Exserohilum turcicum]